MKFAHLKVTVLVASVFLTACGGGGGSNDNNPPIKPDVPVVPVVPVVPGTDNNELSVYCSGANCGAVDKNTYAGSGVGIWQHDNTTQNAKIVNVNINGLQGRSLYASLVNLTNKPVNVSGSNMNNFLEASEPFVKKSVLHINGSSNSQDEQNNEQFHNVMNNFNKESLKSLILAPKVQKKSLSNLEAEEPKMLSVNDMQSFSFYNSLTTSYENKNFRLVKIVSAPDNRNLQYWVQDSEWNSSKVISSDVELINSKFVKTYNENRNLNGNPYGPVAENYSNLIPSANQPINVLLGNISPNDKGYGVIGYFYSINNFKKSSYPTSNEALQVFIDTESIYRLDGTYQAEGTVGRRNGLELTASSLIHEFSHMIAYYERNLTLGLSDTIEVSESLALSTEVLLEDLAKFNVDVFSVRSWPFFLKEETNKCGVYTWAKCANSYERTTSLMAFFDSKYGQGFHQDYVKSNNTDMFTMMNKAVTTMGGNMREDIKKFSILNAGVDKEMPVGFGLPGYTGGGLKMKKYNGILSGNGQKMTNVNTLPDFGAIYFVNSGLSANEIQKTVEVPPGTALIVMVK